MLECLFDAEPDFPVVLNALRQLRVHALVEERVLHEKIKDVLRANNIGYRYEYALGPRNRVDFLTFGGTAIECKKKKPNERSVIQQLERYASFADVRSIVLVIERYHVLPPNIGGKPCASIGLNRLWGFGGVI
ncbi:hypothetical protein Theco_4081 (plasmid) [Thermobacillus composti KWC4]|uniref:DUF4143 domain-containing protein n=1 Tax=Thermobacillus composti (strain DSM 18247 / JCM 13945 / KWC4) TaxID=717605 RepID=L0ELB3_THECK|nr:hypothetical protein Theco_4081 [Thermobacillus composti KWC4]